MFGSEAAEHDYRQGTDLHHLAAEHDYRQGTDLHHLAEKGKAVHPGHFHVQRDHVAVHVGEFFEGLDSILGHRGHLDFRIRLQHIDDHPAHEGRIVDHHNLDHGLPPAQS